MKFNGEDIKELRLKLMLSQTEFAKLLDVSYETVNRYENNRSYPTYKVQRKLNVLFKKQNKEENK